MNIREAMAKMVGESNRAEVSRRMGRTNSYTTALMQRDNTTVSTFCELADVTGHDVVVRDRNTGEEILIDPPEK